jgi:glycosyltransferase involved in cell wall biosynthesis
MRERRRVLVVIDSMQVGGSQRQVQHLLESLDRDQWLPELAYFRTGSFLVDAVRASGVVVHYLPKQGRLDRRFLAAYARLLRERDYALVHAYSLTAELWTLLAGMVSGRRPVLVASERSSVRTDRPAWFWWLKRFVLGRSAAVIANSRAGAQATAQRTGMPDTLFTAIPNDVKLPDRLGESARCALRASVGAPRDRPMGLFVGRLAPVKNLACLVRALALMDPEQRPWMAIVGDGPLRESLARLAAESGVASSVCFLGERKDATQLMQASDFLVLPSHFEGLSNALLEAMAAGCPVVASAVGGSVELIENERSGLLFPSDDAAALAVAMARLAEPALRSRLAESARQHVEQHYSPAALAAATSAVYERCLLGIHESQAHDLAHADQGR